MEFGMVQLKLTLKSKKPSNVYALNGKAYRLQPGQNTLNLEYDDYVSLAKALGIKPVDKDSARSELVKKVEDKPADVKQDVQLQASEPEPTNESEHGSEPITEQEHESVPESNEEHEQESMVESESDTEDSTDNADEDNNDAKGIDYESWSYTKLKAEYKRITGRNCKLKKAEVIQFLQEHN
jgi:hypothetical protein